MVAQTEKIVTYRRLHNGDWGLYGPALIPGTLVTVTRRNGSLSRHVVGRIVWSGADGATIATIRQEQPAGRGAAPIASGLAQTSSLEAYDHLAALVAAALEARPQTAEKVDGAESSRKPIYAELDGTS